MKKNLKLKTIGATFLGIVGLTSINNTETSKYWYELSGYYSSNSEIELQPKLVEINKILGKDSITKEDLYNLELFLYSQIPQDLESIKKKYYLRKNQLENKTEIEISNRTNSKLSLKEIKERMNKNSETIENTVPNLVNIYVKKLNKKFDLRLNLYKTDIKITSENKKIEYF